MKVFLDGIQRTEKEKGNSRIDSHICDFFEDTYQEYSIEEIAYVLIHGVSIVPMEFKENEDKRWAGDKWRRLAKNWLASELFILDFDNKPNQKKPIFYMKDCERISQEVGIHPTFVYHTFSHTPKYPRWRMVFQFAHRVVHMEVRDLIINSLYKIFDKRADHMCIKAANQYYNGGHTLYDWKYQQADIATLTEYPKLDFDMFDKIESVYKDKCGAGYGRDIKRFYASLKKHEPGIYCSSLQTVAPVSALIRKLDEKQWEQYNKSIMPLFNDMVHISYPSKLGKPSDDSIYSTGVPQFTNYWTLIFAPSHGLSQQKAAKQSSTNNKPSLHKVRNGCLKDCALLDATDLEFYERWHVINNLSRVSGGIKMLNTIAENQSYKHPTSVLKDEIVRIVDGNKQRGYEHPTNCTDEFCRFFNQCPRKGKNIVDQIAKTRPDPILLKAPKYITLKEAEEELLSTILQDDPLIVKAQTALGKTEQYTNALQDLKGQTLIVVPTHNLGDEIKERIENKLNEDITKLESLYDRLPEDIQYLYARYSEIGVGKSLTYALKYVGTQRFDEIVEILKDYRSYFKEAMSKKTLITTHSMFIRIQEKFMDFDRVFIDEDIINELIVAKQVKEVDMLKLSRDTIHLDFYIDRLKDQNHISKLRDKVDFCSNLIPGFIEEHHKLNGAHKETKLLKDFIIFRYMEYCECSGKEAVEFYESYFLISKQSALRKNEIRIKRLKTMIEKKETYINHQEEHFKECRQNLKEFFNYLFTTSNNEIDMSKFETLPSAAEFQLALDNYNCFDYDKNDFILRDMGKNTNKHIYSSNVIQWVETKKLYNNGKNEWTYAITPMIDWSKNIKIFSATIDEWMWSKLVPEMKFQEITRAQMQGKVVQYFDEDFSRKKMEKIKSRLPEIFKEVFERKMKVITFKKFVTDFKNAGFDVIAHFGATEGLDKYKGCDIAVIGTPRCNPYRVIAMADALNCDVHIDMLNDTQDLSDKPVIRNGWKFRMFTFENEDLRHVHHWLIEKELIQAIGRARTLRNDCEVYVYSNFMIEDVEKPS